MGVREAFHTQKEEDGGNGAPKPVDPVRNANGIEHFMNVVE
ncbi:hypothetical protein LOT_1400 [Lentilactobacillus otakiensis DSM 19908 = JCM 15040]|uniref:Uncharacterized protein n=1 Tax=Lentilactobacillus otakiensis DSM 19908 = JCM 15040 TaxID=1423780 RepID=S4NI23_9LACO|nr:hypothetical protein LOT_1400 [Lentilactobacillus otakiensis DSM 19908 = JCM 15040]